MPKSRCRRGLWFERAPRLAVFLAGVGDIVLQQQACAGLGQVVEHLPLSLHLGRHGFKRGAQQLPALGVGFPPPQVFGERQRLLPQARRNEPGRLRHVPSIARGLVIAWRRRNLAAAGRRRAQLDKQAAQLSQLGRGEAAAAARLCM